MFADRKFNPTLLDCESQMVEGHNKALIASASDAFEICKIFILPSGDRLTHDRGLIPDLMRHDSIESPQLRVHITAGIPCATSNTCCRDETS